MSLPSYHVHFGAGKLGLGFVLPILYDLHGPIALFQRPGSKEWEKLSPKDDVHLTVNSQFLLKCKYITDNCNPAEVQQYIDRREHLFVSTCNVDILRSVLRVTSSFSTAVAAGGLGDVFNGLALLPSYPPETCIYTFENDFKAVDEFRRRVSEAIPGLTVISVMCDRICTCRDINSNEVNTVTEDFEGTAVVFSSNHSYCHPFTTPNCMRRRSTPNSVVLASTPAEETHYYNRKFSLLNGVHYTMAVFAYALLLEEGVPHENWLDQPLAIWKKIKKNEEDLTCLIEARMLLLINQTDNQTLHHIYNTNDKKHILKELQSFSANVLRRIASTQDITGRILNLKNPSAIQTKFTQHFLPLHDFLRKGKDGQFSDIVAHPHSTYLSALDNWERKIRSVVAPFSIELPPCNHLPTVLEETKEEIRTPCNHLPTLPEETKAEIGKELLDTPVRAISATAAC